MRNFVVQEPATIKGVRKDRAIDEFKCLVSISKVGIKAPELSLDADTNTRNRRAKALVQNQIPEDCDDLRAF